MQSLNNLKITFTLTREAVLYIEKYKRILKKKREDNDRYVIEPMDRRKTMRQLINREIGKAPENDHNLE